MKIALNLNDVQEARPVAGGVKYDLIVATAEECTSQKGDPQVKVSVGIVGQETAPNVTHYISLPNGSDPKKDNFKALMLRRFLEAFSIPYDAEGFAVEDFLGAQATLELSLSEPNDNGDVYNRLVLPKLRTEAGPGTTAVAHPPKR
jgi:hypothetical protein